MAHHLTDLQIELQDKPGTVAAAAEALGKAGINIEGFACFEVGGKGIGRILVEDAPKARQALESSGARVTGENQVVVLELEDKPGALGSVTRKIAQAGVSLNSVYLATRTRVVIGAKEIEKVRSAVGTAAAGQPR
ncbi:MAG TPA: ACT domain-containing protein [Candidatus Dormibacteraeota bacterium]|nr:ACT domain-containing protein [Candidatus Dormibacteraeota bacterium]